MVESRSKVAVLMGGPDEEHHVSLRSGEAVSAALRSKGYHVGEVVIDEGNLWHFPGDDIPKSVGRALDHLRRDYDVVFVALHGRTGEGGLIQGALELVDIPFTGSDQCSSAMAMDKLISRELYSHRGIPTAAGCGIGPESEEEPKKEAKALLKEYGPSVFVKPVDSGSSYGIEIIDSQGELERRIVDARKGGHRLLLEKNIEGVEYTVAVLEDGDEPRGLPPILIKPLGDAPFFTLDIKYDPDAVDEICPAPIGPDELAQLIDLGVQAHQTLGCRDFSRTDIIWGADGPVVLETNTIPGLTDASLFPKAARVAGIEFPELVAGLVDNAMKRGTSRSR